MDPFAHCEAVLREHDPDAHAAALFAPAAARPHLHALGAFVAETGRVRDLVSNPLAGEIRLQWWRDVVEGGGEPAGNPVAEALRATMEARDLPRALLLAHVDARMDALYDDLPATTNDYEGRLGDLWSAPLRLGALVLAGEEGAGSGDAPGHAGVALGIVEGLRRFGARARRGQVELPADLLARQGVTREEIAAGRDTPGLREVLDELRALARAHAGKARAALRALPAPARPALRRLALARPYLKRLDRAADVPFGPPPELTPLGRLASLARGP